MTSESDGAMVNGWTLNDRDYANRGTPKGDPLSSRNEGRVPSGQERLWDEVNTFFLHTHKIEQRAQLYGLVGTEGEPVSLAATYAFLARLGTIIGAYK